MLESVRVGGLGAEYEFRHVISPSVRCARINGLQVTAKGPFQPYSGYCDRCARARIKKHGGV